MTQKPNARAGIVALLGLAAFVFLFGALSIWQPRLFRDFLAGRNDFAGLYTAGRLAGSPDLYSFEANERIQMEAVGALPEPRMIYDRPPFYSVLLMPLATLPYRAAYAVFEVLNIFCLCAAVWLFARRSVEIAVLASVSVPILLGIMQGQDTGFFTLGYAAFYTLLERGRGFLAGLSLSICLIKLHLFPLTAIALLLRREWGALKGAASAVTVLIAASFAAFGGSWPSMYWAALRGPNIDLNPKIMPNLHGLATLMGWGRMTEAVLMATVLAAFVVAAVRAERPLLYALALVGGLLLSFHAYPQDATLLLLALGILDTTAPVVWFQQLLRVSLTPLPYAFLSLRNRWSTILVLLLLGAFASGAWQAARRKNRWANAALMLK
ncbi:MAG TPA: glycosyltransferase family 87 protein [Bryobacteraceae bacterium]|nr:glycosyltransferase family 87 protein [Bryobacteraceae bacterium]